MVGFVMVGSAGCSDHSSEPTNSGSGGKSHVGAGGEGSEVGGAGGEGAGGGGGEDSGGADTASGGNGIENAGGNASSVGGSTSGGTSAVAGAATGATGGIAVAQAGSSTTSGVGGRTGTGGKATGVAGAAGAAGHGTCPSGSTSLCVLSGSALGTAPADSDCDGIPDAIEIGPNGKQPLDTDGNATADYLQVDSDADTIPDSAEVGAVCNLPRDSDGDNLPDYRDTDSDGNGIPDAQESTTDTDADGTGDWADLDDDGDFLSDLLELGISAATPRDTDADGIPDLKDTDSDNDNILDRDERASDPDVDGLPNYRDPDSDADGVADKAEAGDGALLTPPVDSDKDGLADFLDLDSDDDGLLDSVEDANHDGILDPGETDRSKSDTDGDGVSDLIEVAAGTDPAKVNDTPAAHGNFVFLMPYQKAPSPSQATLDFATKISWADIFLLIDTTRSMDGEIANLQQSLTSLIIPRLAADIDSIAIGVGSYRDFPSSTYGTAGDWPFRLDHRIMTVKGTAGVASLQSVVNGLAAGGGNDTYEASWEALHQVAKGNGNSTGGASIAAFDAATSYPSAAAAGESLGTIPGVGFRSGALPIAVLFTDAPGHNTDSPLVTANDYAAPVSAARSTQVIDEFNAMSAKIIGVTSGTSIARDDVLTAVNGTGATVPPKAWGTGASRPLGCAADQCCTGLAGAGEAPNSAGSCPLAFRMNDDGSGLGAAVVTAIEVLTTYGAIDVSARPVDDPTDSVDAVSSFIDGIIANPFAGAPCDSGLTAVDRNGDGKLDTFVDVLPGKRVCFDVIPKTNSSVPATEAPQMFKASISILGDEVTLLDSRSVYFLVPPAAPQ